MVNASYLLKVLKITSRVRAVMIRILVKSLASMGVCSFLNFYKHYKKRPASPRVFFGETENHSWKSISWCAILILVD